MQEIISEIQTLWKILIRISQQQNKTFRIFADKAVMNILNPILECGFADLICLDSSIH